MIIGDLNFYYNNSVDGTFDKEINFGIQRVPIAQPKIFESLDKSAFSTDKPNSVDNNLSIDFPSPSGISGKNYQWILLDENNNDLPNGNGNINGYHNGALEGKDDEDCPSAGDCNGTTASRTFAISSIESNTKLFYDFGAGNGGVKEINVSSGPVVIENFEASNLVLYAVETYKEILTYGFEYSLIDKFGAVSVPVSYKITPVLPLPIHLEYFNALKSGQNALLEWATVSEINNSGFYILRSTNASDWSEIAFIETKAEGGNSLQRTIYEHIDTKPLIGANYYRLKQEDFDGKTSLSNIRMVIFNDINDLQLYPNPVKDYLNLTGLEGAEFIEITDITGRTLISKNVESKTLSLDLNNLKSGIYFLRITDQNKNLVIERFIKE